jgi:hypothetical protein
MVVNPIVTPTVSITASPNDTVCAGTAVTYSATAGGASGYGYQWIVNGSVVGTGVSYSYTPANGDSIRCVVTTSAPCATVVSASSNTVHMVVNTWLDPVVSISVTPNDTVCAGTSATYNTTIIGGGSTPTYRWWVNGSFTGGTASSYSYTPSNGDSVQCVLISSYSCATSSSDTSPAIHMVVNPIVTPTVSITATPNDTVCASTTVTYSATAGGASGYGYQWIVNGSVVGTGVSYSYTPGNGDSIRCIVSTSAPCATVVSASSNTVNMVVNTWADPVVSISITPNDTVCAGTSVTYNTTITGGGSAPTYRWWVNGSFTGGTASSYSYTPSNGDSVQCVLVSSFTCATSSSDTSTAIYMVVNPILTPAVSISASPDDTLCETGAVSFAASILHGGTTPGYQWYVNGSPAGTLSTYSYTAVSGDSIRCLLNSNEDCASPTSVSSNTINMFIASMVHPAIALSGPVVAAIGSTVTITATLTGAGSSYTLHWYNYGAAFATTTTPTVNYTKTLATDSITARIVSSDFCTDSTNSTGHMVYDRDLAASPTTPGEREVRLWPNPVRDVLHVEYADKIHQLEIFNLLGQTVLISNTGQSEINLSDLSPALYLVKVNGLYIQKILVAR